MKQSASYFKHLQTTEDVTVSFLFSFRAFFPINTLIIEFIQSRVFFSPDKCNSHAPPLIFQIYINLSTKIFSLVCSSKENMIIEVGQYLIYYITYHTVSFGLFLDFMSKFKTMRPS